VPLFSFNWQIEYHEAAPVVVPKSTRMECTAHFDNPGNKPLNPNPKVEVRCGDQSWEEMMIGWLGVIVDAKGRSGDGGEEAGERRPANNGEAGVFRLLCPAQKARFLSLVITNCMYRF
jgi:hypothetical protein